MQKPYQSLIDPPLGEGLATTDGYVEPRRLCATNQTRGCILGKEVACGDFSFASLLERMPRLTPQSGSGLWLVPFKGIPTDDVRVLLDLIYLDAECRVIALVDLFPSYRVSPSVPSAASVLVLPSDTIYSSGTHVGDQIAFSLTEEAEQELARTRNTNAILSAAQEELARLEDEKTRAAALPQPAEKAPATPPAEANAAAQMWTKQLAKPKNWWQRLLYLAPATPQDPRNAPRAALPGLAAYFWDGGAPRAHEIRDISATGLYVVTDERWYPGTMVQMTLKKTSGNGVRVEASITLMVRANRWGNDGVGLSYVVRDARHPREEDAEGVESELLERFLARIKPGNA